MPTSADPAISRALGFDKDTKITSHGGSGFASTYQLTTSDSSYFVKTSSSSGAAVMFKGEHESLNAIHNAVPSLCPKSFAWGKLDKGGYFLVTEFLEIGRTLSKTKDDTLQGSGMSLAQKLASLHSKPAPIPEGYDKPQYGFQVSTCCGDTPQSNDFTSSWSEFFAQNRLSMILERNESNHGTDAELRRVIERTVQEIVPRLLGDEHLGGKDGIQPVVTHGDLWSGNKGKATFVGRKPGLSIVEDVIFDPSVVYAHNEYDFGIMNMFGGFSSNFWKEYHSIVPKSDPVEEYDDRVALYESYHHLNHYAIFGGSYRSGAMRILKRLLAKYGLNG